MPVQLGGVPVPGRCAAGHHHTQPAPCSTALWPAAPRHVLRGTLCSPTGGAAAELARYGCLPWLDMHNMVQEDSSGRMESSCAGSMTYAALLWPYDTHCIWHMCNTKQHAIDGLVGSHKSIVLCCSVQVWLMPSGRVCWTVSLAGRYMRSNSTGRSSCSCVCTPWHSIMQQHKAGGREPCEAHLLTQLSSWWPTLSS